jgi:biotin operon repressor
MRVGVLGDMIMTEDMGESNVKRDVLEVLQGQRGRGNAVTTKEIANNIGLNYEHDTVPEVRKVIKELLNDGHGVASCNQDFYMVESIKDLNNYMEDMRTRIKGLHMDHMVDAFWDNDETA